MIVLVSRDLAASLSSEREDRTEVAPGIRPGGFVAGSHAGESQYLAQGRRTMSDELQFHSMDEIRAYIRQELERQLALERKKMGVWRTAKQGTLLVTLIVVYLQYYLLDIMYQMLTLPTIEVSVPVAKTPLKARS